MTDRLSVVLFNLGGPDSLAAVRPFLFNLFSDRAIIGLPQPFRWLVAQAISRSREKTAMEIYRHMGGSSPLGRETEAQRLALEEVLRQRLACPVQVVVAMRYWRPFTREAARQVEAFAPNKVVLLPLYPQFSTTTTGSSLRVWRDEYKGSGQEHAICCYPVSFGFVDAHVKTILAALGDRSIASVRVIFSAHGLPESIIARGDPYQDQIERTTAAVASRLGSSDWRVCYQSRVGPMKWIGPTTLEMLEEAGRDGVGVLVVPVAFVSEHSETLVELDRDYAEAALRFGVPIYLRAPAIGVDPGFIAALADMVTAAAGESAVPAPAPPCAATFTQCAYRLCLGAPAL